MNAVLTRDWVLLRSRDIDARQSGRLARPGLGPSLVVGLASALFIASATRQPLGASGGEFEFARVAVASALVGWAAVRLLASEVDKRVLAAAATLASAAPAAPPEIVERIGSAPPREVYAIAALLMPHTRQPDAGGGATPARGGAVRRQPE